MRNVYETLEFFDDVLHRDCKLGILRYHIMRYWNAEENIRNRLRRLMTKSEQNNDSNPWTKACPKEVDSVYTVDFSSDRFDELLEMLSIV